MTNAIYDVGRYLFAMGQLVWPTQKLIMVAFAGPPTFVATDRHITDIINRGTTTVLKASLDLVNKAVSPEGYLQSGPVVVPTVPIGPPVTHFVMATYTATWNDGVPIFYFDEGLNLPFETNGLDIVIQPDWLEQRGWGRV